MVQFCHHHCLYALHLGLRHSMCIYSISPGHVSQVPPSSGSHPCCRLLLGPGLPLTPSCALCLCVLCSQLSYSWHRTLSVSSSDCFVSLVPRAELNVLQRLLHWISSSACTRRSCAPGMHPGLACLCLPPSFHLPLQVPVPAFPPWMHCERSRD